MLRAVQEWQIDLIIDAVSFYFYDAVPIEAYTYSNSLLESIILSSVASHAFCYHPPHKFSNCITFTQNITFRWLEALAQLMYRIHRNPNLAVDTTLNQALDERQSRYFI